MSVRNCGSRCWSRDNCCEQAPHPCHSINTQFGRVVKRLLSLFLQKCVHILLVWSIKRKFVLVKSVVILLSSSIAMSYSTILTEAWICLLVRFPSGSSIHLTTIPAFCRGIPKASWTPRDPPSYPCMHQKSHTGIGWKTILSFLRQNPRFGYLGTVWHAQAFFTQAMNACIIRLYGNIWHIKIS